MIDASGGVTLICAENLSVLIASACDFLRYAVRIVASESLTKSLGAPDTHQRRTAFEFSQRPLNLGVGNWCFCPIAVTA